MIDEAALRLDRIPELELTAFSRMFETPPWGDTDQPDFFNAVAFGSTSLNPEELLLHTRRIEHDLGKRVIRQWGPRCIDIDVLHCGFSPLKTDSIEIPHPRARDRPFVYLPLGDLPVPEEWQFLLNPSAGGRAIESVARVADGGRLWPSRCVPRAISVVTGSAEETEKTGFQLGAVSQAHDFFALDGPLGAGKTAFVHGLARGLEIDGPIQSPSYTLCRDYRTGRVTLQHWDFYRLESEDDLESTGFFDKVEADAVVAVEWAGRFPGDLPAHHVGIRIERGEIADRRILHLQFPPGALLMRRLLGSANGS